MDAPLPVQFELRRGCLVAQVSGPDAVVKKEAIVRRIAAEMQATNPRVTLIDFRGMSAHVGFIDRFQMGLIAARYFAGWTVGVLAKETLFDSRRIGQLVAMNRGVRVELFSDPIAAEAWVEKQTAPVQEV